jgi:hypothetical protein
MVATGNYISRTHSEDEDHDSDTDYTDMVFHIDVICFTISRLEDLDIAKSQYNFDQNVEWVDSASSYAQLSKYFGTRRNLRETGSISIELGYVFKNKVAEKFVVLYQIPNESD